MAFSLGSRLVSNMPLSEYLKTVVSGFRVIELPADPRYLSPHFAYTQAQIKTLRIYQDRYQFRLTMHAPFTDCRLGALDPDERSAALQKMYSALQLASELHIRLFTFHPTTLEPGQPEVYRENYRYEEESIAKLLEKARNLGVTLLIENMPKHPHFHPNTSDGSRHQELLWLFPDNHFGLTVDIGHALQAGVSVDSLLKMNRIKHFHIHDNDRCLDRHYAITNQLDWWGKLIKKLTRKFTEASAILEMNQLDDQMTSFYHLKPFIKPSGLPK
ncbi:MAG TPA: sugar phosphate isomerase/epimerase family protein [Bacillota bacterium]|nr:sugar phosphate isomerase/epimerase family protein [Bacillota bacterium]